MRSPSYSHGVSTQPLLGDTIGLNLARTVQRVPGHDALVSVQQDVRLTYRELLDAVDRIATGLLARGVEPGDRVGVWSPNCAEWVLVQYATARVGAILVNVNPAYRTHELTYALRQSGMRLLFCAERFKTSDYVAMVEEARPEVAGLQEVIVFGSAAWDAIAGTPADVDAVERRGAELAPDDPINIQYTIGTTGSPKGATLSHHNILNNGYFVTELLGYT